MEINLLYIYMQIIFNIMIILLIVLISYVYHLKLKSMNQKILFLKKKLKLLNNNYYKFT